MEGDTMSNTDVPENQAGIDWMLNEYFSENEPPAANGHSKQNHAGSSTGATLLQRMERYIAQVGNASEGNRDNAAFSLAGNLLAFVDAQTGEAPAEADICRLMLEWDQGNDPPLGEQMIRTKVRSARDNGTPREPKVGGSGSRTRPQIGTDAPAKPPAAPTFEGPHGIKLVATDANEFGSGKVQATYTVYIDGAEVAPLKMTTSATATKDAARELGNWLAAQWGENDLPKKTKTELHQFIFQVGGEAKKTLATIKEIKNAQASQQQQPDGPSMQQLVIEHAPRLAGLAFRNEDGSAWSETMGRTIDQREFEKRVPSELIREVEQANDYPEDAIGGSAPIGKLRQYLTVAWTDAVNHLPREEQADTGPESAAAKRYTDAIVRLFNIRERWRKTFKHDGSEHSMDSATLAQLAREAVERYQQTHVTQASGWWRIHNQAIDAWCCLTPRLDLAGNPTGEVPDAWLGFRYELIHQLPKHSRPDIPNTRNMNELGRLASRYGIAATEDNAPAPFVKESGHKRRLIVLNRQLCDQILWQVDGE
jgi:hypothetical protein